MSAIQESGRIPQMIRVELLRAPEQWISETETVQLERYRFECLGVWANKNQNVFIVHCVTADRPDAVPKTTRDGNQKFLEALRLALEQVTGYPVRPFKIKVIDFEDALLV